MMVVIMEVMKDNDEDDDGELGISAGVDQSDGLDPFPYSNHQQLDATTFVNGPRVSGIQEAHSHHHCLCWIYCKP